jgi:sugar/nucleoside kinase (ribokinase family)
VFDRVVKKRILCVGAAVLDTIFRVRELPRGEGKILPYQMLQIAEGMASSAACAIVRLGGEATLWGAVGDDETGARIRVDLAREGVDVGAMTIVPDVPSAVSTILVDDRGDRLIVPFYDPRLHADLPSFSDEAISWFDVVLVDVRWPALAQEVLVAARRVGVPAILDGDVAPPDVLERLAAEADYVIFSEPAARALSGCVRRQEVVRELAARFPDALICVTFGADGALWQDLPSNRPDNPAQILHQPALDIVPVDTLAAGDAFHGAFALALAEGGSITHAIRLGSVTAALKCKVFGGRTGMPSRQEAEQSLGQLTQSCATFGGTST